MAKKVLKTRDKFFWICVGFGVVLSVYFLYKFFTKPDIDLSNFNIENYKKQFSLYVPKYMLPIDSIYEKSVLQYSDYAKEVFLVVVEEKKLELKRLGLQPSIQEYGNYVLVAVESALSEPLVTSKKENIINELPALTYELEGDFGDQHVFYVFTVYESGEYFYQVISWTNKAIKPEVKKDIYTTMQSFTQLR